MQYAVNVLAGREDNATQPMTVDAFPRFRKWNIQTIAEMVESNALESINEFVGNDCALEPTMLEREQLFSTIMGEDSDFANDCENTHNGDDVSEAVTPVFEETAMDKDEMNEARVDNVVHKIASSVKTCDRPCQVVEYDESSAKRQLREDALRKYILSLEIKNTRLSKANSELNKKLEVQSKECATSDSINAGLKQKLKSAEARVVELNTVIKKQKRDIADSVEERHALNARMTEMEGLINTLSEDLTIQQELPHTSRHKHSTEHSMQNEIESLKARIKALTNELESSTKTEKELRAELQKSTANNIGATVHTQVMDGVALLGVDQPSFSLNLTQQLTQDHFGTLSATDLELIDLQAHIKQLQTENESLEQQVARLKGKNHISTDSIKGNKDDNADKHVHHDIVVLHDNDLIGIDDCKTMRKNSTYKRINVYDILTESDQKKVEYLAEHFPLQHILWDGKNSNSDEHIDLEDIFILLEGKSITGTIIDVCTYLLTRQQDEGCFTKNVNPKCCGRSLIFPSLLLV
ncbi:hypothetical protein ACP275_08G104500 [Erythranthe tilingii]